jgi:hypothetical protein
MVAMHHEQAPTPLADDGSNRLLLVVGRTIRDNLHTLFALSLLFLVVALPWVILATLTSWTVAWAPLVLLTAPVWAAIVAGADRLLAGEAASWRSVSADLHRLALPALRIGMAPALCGTALLVAAPGENDGPWRGAAFLATAGIAIAVLALLIPAVPLATRYALSGLTLWQASAVIVTRRPVQVLGTMVLAGAGLWMALAFGPAVLLGAAPLGVLVAAITMPDPEVEVTPTGDTGATPGC